MWVFRIWKVKLLENEDFFLGFSWNFSKFPQESFRSKILKIFPPSFGNFFLCRWYLGTICHYYSLTRVFIRSFYLCSQKFIRLPDDNYHNLFTLFEVWNLTIYISCKMYIFRKLVFVVLWNNVAQNEQRKKNTSN